jgi:hypothetical protein
VSLARRVNSASGWPCSAEVWHVLDVVGVHEEQRARSNYNIPRQDVVEVLVCLTHYSLPPHVPLRQCDVKVYMYVNVVGMRGVGVKVQETLGVCGCV